jgi:glycosyltransferase involved in cell wall biosynthesis
MALGKAILGSGVGGIRELIDPDVTGVLFEPGNVADFCEKARRLLRDENLRRALEQNARSKMSREKDWGDLVRVYEAVYDAAVRNARRRA